MKIWILYWLGLQASQALAQGPSPLPPATPPAASPGLQIDNPLQCEDGTECVSNLLGGLVVLAAPVAAIIILIGGFQIMASGGNEEKLKAGKATILYAALGYGIILLAGGAASIIQDFVHQAAEGTIPGPY